MANDNESRMKRMLKQYGLIMLFIFVTVALMVSTVYFYRQYRSRPMSTAESVSEADVFIEKVGKHMLLPRGEMPKVLTVTDKERLSGKAFFANAKNGNKVLVYEKANKAILYDPGADRIVDVGPVEFGEIAISPSPAPQTEPTPNPQPIRVYLYNGTPVNGLTRDYDITLRSVYPNAVVVDRDTASRTDYDTSVIVDLTGENATEAASIAKALDLTVSAMPEGEIASAAAELLIILGADKR